MHRLASTVVCVVGERAQEVLAPLREAANVTLVLPDPQAPAAERAVTAWTQSRAAATPYVVHDADPLADVAAAWVARYDGLAPAGALEVALSTAVERLRTQEIGLPDNLLVLDAQCWPPTRRHWYLGVLAAAAPARVVPVAAHSRQVRRALAALPTGRWWPEPAERLLAGVDRVVPDRVGLPGGD